MFLNVRKCFLRLSHFFAGFLDCSPSVSVSCCLWVSRIVPFVYVCINCFMVWLRPSLRALRPSSVVPACLRWSPSVSAACCLRMPRIALFVSIFLRLSPFVFFFLIFSPSVSAACSVRLRLSPSVSVCAVAVSVCLRLSPFVSFFLLFSPSVSAACCIRMYRIVMVVSVFLRFSPSASLRARPSFQLSACEKYLKNIAMFQTLK